MTAANPPPAGFEPAPTTSVAKLLGAESRKILVGAVRAVRGWPGLLAVAVAYGLGAIGFSQHSYPQLLAGLVAAVVGVAWYLSPLRGWEARRRRRGTAS